MKELPFELKRMLDALGAKENVPMAQYTSFKTGGSVRILAEPDTAEHTAELMRLIEVAGVEHYVIGNGTNLLISDKGLDAIVVRIGEKMANVERSGRTIIAGAGASYAAMAKQSVQWGLMGLEWAAGIPGTVGGAVAMNAGAYGGETADALKTVIYAENGAIIKETVDKTAFGGLRSAGHKLYFFSKYSKDDAKERMELDFLIAKDTITSKHNISPIEVKSTNRYTLTSLKKCIAKYDSYLATPYVLHTADLKVEEGITYLPLYMTGLL